MFKARARSLIVPKGMKPKWIVRPVTAHGKYRVKASQGGFFGPFRRIAGFLRFPQFDFIEHRFQLSP